MGNCVVARPNEAMFISGCTGTEVVVGSCGCSLWFCNHVESLGLEIMTIHVISKDAETTRGVRIDVDSVAQLKVQTHLDADGKRSSHKRLVPMHCCNGNLCKVNSFPDFVLQC